MWLQWTLQAHMVLWGVGYGAGWGWEGYDRGAGGQGDRGARLRSVGWRRGHTDEAQLGEFQDHPVLRRLLESEVLHGAQVVGLGHYVILQLHREGQKGPGTQDRHRAGQPGSGEGRSRASADLYIVDAFGLRVHHEEAVIEVLFGPPPVGQGQGLGAQPSPLGMATTACSAHRLIPHPQPPHPPRPRHHAGVLQWKSGGTTALSTGERRLLERGTGKGQC